MQLFSGRSKRPERKSGGGGGGGGRDHAAVMAKEKAAGAGARQRNGRCRALCCSASRLSVSSSASCSSVEYAVEQRLPPPQSRGLSNLAHGMVQARLQSMIDAAAGRSSAASRPRPLPRHGTTETAAERQVQRGGPCRCACNYCGGHYDDGGGGASCGQRRPCVVLVAVDRRTSDPREEFRRSIAEVITAKRMAEPAELRALLNCYVSVNAREHRAAILEAFHEVCSGLFSRKR